MNDTLEYPSLAAPDAATAAIVASIQPAAPEPGTLKATALASFVAIRSHAAKLAEKYRAVAYDVTTPKGMAAAKDARLELREEGRFAVQRLRDRLKDEANDLKRVVSDEAEAVIKIIAPVEDAIHAQITAEEERKKAEKAEAARILAERQQKQAEGVAGIRAYLSRAQTTADMTAERVGNGIKMLEGMTFAPADWLDPVAAANAQCETLEGLRTLKATLLAREIEADRLEAQRLQQEAERAELERQAAAMRAEQARIARLTAMIAEIRAAATGHEHATAADLYEARVAVAALDTSEAVYQELAPLANAAQLATLAVLDKFHAEATDREQRAEVERVLSIPLPLLTPGEIVRVSGMEPFDGQPFYTPPPFAGYAEHPIYNPEDPPPESTEGQEGQQVLKAEGESPDATDRATPADTSPCVGTMGAGQASDEAPAAEPLPAPVARAMAADPAAPLHAREAAAEILELRSEHQKLVGALIDVGVVKDGSLPEPTMTLGEFNTFIAPLRIDAAGLELLGFRVARTFKAAKYYNDTDKAAMVAAMVKHLQGL